MARRGLQRWPPLSQRPLFRARLHLLERGGWLRSANRPPAKKVSVDLLELTSSGGSPDRDVTNGHSHPGVPPTGNDQEDLCANVLRHEQRGLPRQLFAGGGAFYDDGTRGGSATVRIPPCVCTLNVKPEE